MAYSARILLDSITESGERLTTMELVYPRFVHSEFMTHRLFSRNAASSRAIPIEKMIRHVREDPVMPVWWGKNQSGMQAREELNGVDLTIAQEQWLRARDNAISAVNVLSAAKLHKQIANRLLEPWMWITVIVSATEWKNFFALRCHPDAQPELQKIAFMMRDQYENNTPTLVPFGSWHLPLYTGIDDYSHPLYNIGVLEMIKISVGRCARVSYLTHDGKHDPRADIELHDRLMNSGHWSPFEHVATPIFPNSNESVVMNRWSGNFHGWVQYRQLVDTKTTNSTRS